MISNSGHDENGKYSGGRAGDQTGTEWQIIPWYSRPWNVILRHPDEAVRSMIAQFATDAANNNNIGYDQNQRTTFWKQLELVGYEPSKVTTKCEADCSAGVTAIVKAAGYKLGDTALKKLSKDLYTGNLRKAFVGAGFKELTADEYLSSDKYLLRGDVLLYEGHHTAINVTDGAGVTSVSNGLHTVTANKQKKYITALQEWINRYYSVRLHEYGRGPIEEDGVYGPKTRAAAVCIWKDLTNRKQRSTLKPESSTFNEACTYWAKTIHLTPGSTGTYAAILKLLLVAKGYKISGGNSVYSAVDHSSLCEYIADNGLPELSSTRNTAAEAWYKLFN